MSRGRHALPGLPDRRQLGDPTRDAIVRAGNERVLVGRLDDAVFSLRQDLAARLEAMAA